MNEGRSIRGGAWAAAGIAACAASSVALSQADVPSKVPLSFEKYHTYDEIGRALADIAAAYPEIATLRSLGKSLEGREMWMLTVNAPRSGPDTSKPAMWIDGAIHANEIQASETVLYTAWYLTKMYGKNPKLTELLDAKSFYLCPMVNPDSRDAWFRGPSTPHNHRHNRRPIDDDHDGLLDEDGPDDLDGDGAITSMWKEDPQGRWERDKDDPRVFRRRPPDKPPGGWTNLGEEGIDNDGDGQINEDDPGGDDMNRNWPAGWLPPYVQYGAGPYPFSHPETRAIGDFIGSHPNIAAVQSYHNAGGMILRGPGADFRGNMYPGGDNRVYDEIGRIGEQLLPYYKYMVIWKDLYIVHGGLVNWTAESQGIFSFTNELWTPDKYFQRDGGRMDEEKQWLWRDRMEFGQLFKDFTEYDHPRYGKILIGGLNQWSSRSTPTFMLPEECHRNFAFTMYHADQMPQLAFERTDVKKLDGELWTITVTIRNQRIIPTRSENAARNHIGTTDLLLCEPLGEGGMVAAAGTVSSLIDPTSPVDLVRHEPGRIRVSGGVPGRGVLHYRFFVTGKPGQKFQLTYRAEKARLLQQEVELAEK